MTRPVHNSNDQSTKSNNFIDKSEKLERYFQTIIQQSGVPFAKLRDDHCQYMKGDCTAVVILSHILNKLSMKALDNSDRKSLIRHKLYFKYPAKEIEERTGMSKDRRIRGMATLMEHGFIRVKRRAGNNLWVRVVSKKLLEVEKWWIAKEIQKSGNTKSDFRSRESRKQKSGIPKTEVGNPEIPLKKNLEKNKKEKNCHRSASDNRVSGFFSSTTENTIPSNNTSPNQFDTNCSHQLQEALYRKGCLKRRCSIIAWSKCFHELRHSEGIGDDQKRIKRVLDWFCQNIRGDKVPETFSATSFCERFIQVENAFIRATRNNKKDWNRLTEDQIC